MDRIEGGRGSDRGSGGGGTDSLFGERGNDRLLGGGGGGDLLFGGAGDDRLDGGGGGRDRLYGGVGDDRVAGGPGSYDAILSDSDGDTLDGGRGRHDTISYSIAPHQFRGQGVKISLLGDNSDRIRRVEDLIGSPYEDRLLGDGKRNVLRGGDGDDVLRGRPGKGTRRDVAFGGGGGDNCRGFAQARSCDDLSAEPRGLRAVVYSGFPLKVLGVIVHAKDEIGGLDGPPQGTPQDGQNDNVRVSFRRGKYVIRNPVGIIAGDGCRRRESTIAVCPMPRQADVVSVNTGFGKDRISIAGSVRPRMITEINSGFYGGDTIRGSSGTDYIFAGTAELGDPVKPRDRVFGRGGDDLFKGGLGPLFGGAGDDLFVATLCAGQKLQGGPGDDAVSFAKIDSGGISPGARVILGGPMTYARDRGCPDRGSVGADVEDIEGSPFDDILIGSSRSNQILGRNGFDIVRGRGGSDRLIGGLGTDRLFGGGGGDGLFAAEGGQDGVIDCGSGAGETVRTDPTDPSPRGC